MTAQYEVVHKNIVEVKLHTQTLYELRRVLVDAGRTLANERRDGFQHAARLLDEELLREGGGGITPWRIERVVEKLRSLSEMEGD